MDKNTKIYVNPTGRFVVGGPHGDAGVTGRKIIVDTYGGAAPHGGGAFSGKDPTKVDRSACYMARYIAKNVVAAGIAERALVQLAYAIGVADPVSVMVHTEGTGRIPEEKITELVRAALQADAARHHRRARTCAGRSTRRRRRSATSAAPSRSSPGSAPTRRRRSSRRPGSERVARVKRAACWRRRPSWPPLLFSSPSRCRPRRLDARRAPRRRHHPRHHPRPHQSIRRPEQPRRDRRGRRARRPEVPRLHRSRRRDAQAGSAAVPHRRAVPRRRRDQHHRRPLRRASTCRRRRIRSPAKPRDVVEDVRRLGGFGIAAHPDSPKPQLRWRDWRAPIDGVELINLDTGWRLWAQQAARRPEQWPRDAACSQRSLDYPFRPAEAIASLIQPTAGAAPAGQRSTRAAARGRDRRRRRAREARARAAPIPATARIALPLPGYESSFRVLSVHVKPERPFSGDAAADARVLMRAIRAGHLYIAVDGVATPPSFEFTATQRARHRPRGRRARRRRTGDAARAEQRAAGVHDERLRTGSTLIGATITSRTSPSTVPRRPAVYWVRDSSRPDRRRRRLDPQQSDLRARAASRRRRRRSRPPATVSVPIFDGDDDRAGASSTTRRRWPRSIARRSVERRRAAVPLRAGRRRAGRAGRGARRRHAGRRRRPTIG